MGKFHCLSCGGWIPPRKMFMVEDKMWEKYGVGKDYLCLNCFQKKAGRNLRFKDFTKCMMNYNNKEIPKD